MLSGLVLLALVSTSWPHGQRDAAAGARAGTIAGRITDRESGRPLPGTIVALAGADPSQPTETVADAEGRYEFSGLDAGRYAVWARPDQHRSTHLPQAADSRRRWIFLPAARRAPSS